MDGGEEALNGTWNKSLHYRALFWQILIIYCVYAYIQLSIFCKIICKMPFNASNSFSLAAKNFQPHHRHESIVCWRGAPDEWAAPDQNSLEV